MLPCFLKDMGIFKISIKNAAILCCMVNIGTRNTHSEIINKKMDIPIIAIPKHIPPRIFTINVIRIGMLTNVEQYL